MGAPAAVRVANIFMYKHTTKFIHNYNLALPPYFGRLIDDISLPGNILKKNYYNYIRI